jgi:hypothetical protein
MPDPAQSNAFTDLDDFLETSLKKGEVLGSWGITSNIDFTKMSVEENNVWFFEQVFNFLRAFFGIVMPDSLEVITHNATQQLNREKLDQMTFLDELMLIMKNLKEPIWSLRLNLSIVGFIRADWDPDNPIRIRIQEPAHFIAWGGPDESGFQSFSVSFRLFSIQEVTGHGVSVWNMNQPLLERAIHKWEEQSGQRIDVVQGNSPDLALSKTGFKEPAPASPQGWEDFDFGDDSDVLDDDPDEDWIPDLEDLKF